MNILDARGDSHCLAQAAMREAIREFDQQGRIEPRLIYRTKEGREHRVPMNFEVFAGLLENRDALHWLSVFRRVGFFFGGAAWTIADAKPRVIEEERQRWPAAAVECLRWAQPKVVVVVQDHIGDLISPRPPGLDKALVVVAIGPVGAVALVREHSGGAASLRTQTFTSVGMGVVVGGCWTKCVFQGRMPGGENN